MLKLKNIKKDYKTGDFVQHALKGVDLTFRENEFVAVLGPSGSGKTTLLNIIGGLDRYDSGDLIIDGKSTKKFKDKDWDAYRNHAIGFVFQSYNLIGHISVLENVEMGMTLSGVSSAERRKKALSLLEKVGLKEHAHKRPNQLSGGQMQRVAIARALANDPKIILADEPTGALDSKTSTQIMDLIKEISKDKLVIMVTHNAELAESYATRIVKMKDGELLSDSKPYDSDESKGNLNIKKTAMSFWTALKLSFGNIRTKKGRTILTAFASSIGIIGIALILSLSNGFNIEVENFEQEIDNAKRDGNSLGGKFEVVFKNLPIGLGSYVQWDRALDGKIAKAVMSIGGIKAVEIGENPLGKTGFEYHDQMFLQDGKIIRKTNNAGGLEGGMTNGEDLIVKAVMKPIPTMVKPLRTVDKLTLEECEAHFERSDTCAVASCCVVAEARIACVLADEILQKYGGDSIEELKRHYRE